MIKKSEVVSSWNQYLKSFELASQDIYFTENYVRLYEDNEQQAVCYVYQENENILLLPFLRSVFTWNGEILYDFETPYGYGGPIVNTDDQGFVGRALNALMEYGKKYGYLAGFIRFHPVLHNSDLCKNVFHIILDRHTVAMDLSMDIDEVWMQEVHTKNRNVIKKAEKNGLTFVADYNYEYLDHFIALYNGTMDKLGATNFYYFADSYYKKLVKNIPDSFLGVVKQGDEVLSAAIFMYSGPYGHYHLSGSNKSKLALSPNNYMLWEAAKELKKQGVERFHLGGGINSDESNSLLLFKMKYSKSLYDFCLGKLIFNQEKYDVICAEWGERNPEKAEQYKSFLLKYKY